MTTSRFFTPEQIVQLNEVLKTSGVTCQVRQRDGFMLMTGGVADSIGRQVYLTRINAMFVAHVSPSTGAHLVDIMDELREVEGALKDLANAGFRVKGV